MKQGLNIIPVSHVTEVLARALVRQPEAIDLDEEAEAAAAAARVVGNNNETATAH